MGAEPQRYAGLRVLVLGLGRFGGGVETARFLQQEGATTVISDASPRAGLAASADAAEALGATLVFGPQTNVLLDDIDALIVSPAMPFDHPVITAARARSLPVTTELNIVLSRCTAPVLGVTGTKGKSTTTTLLAHILRSAGHTVHLGGNIGRPLVGALDTIAPSDRVVLELSSFQLWWTRQIERSPHLTLVTNLMSDHLDRHGTQSEYAKAKRAALDFQSAQDVAVLPASDPAVRDAGWFDAGDARRVTFGPGGDVYWAGDDLCSPHGRAPITAFALPGNHNRHNLLAAAAAAWQCDAVGPAALQQGASAMTALPHRLQPVAEIDGVRYVDDSNATHPESTCVALAAFDAPVLLLAGGKDKGSDITDLCNAIRKGARVLVAIGATGPALVEALAGSDVPAEAQPTLDAAVRRAQALAVPGDVVLLSPAFSSLDQFRSFADRGDQFQAVVRRLAREA